MDSFTFTVGKVDAGMAILIGERAHIIEFPSLLLPPGVQSGSVVNVAVHRNIAEEKAHATDFWKLQDDIFNAYGQKKPSPPQLIVRNTTQTSVTLEWPLIDLATSKLRSLDIYRNGQRLATIPTPTQNTSTKVSGLQLETEYSFQLVLRTTAGTFPSNLVKLKTHSMTNTTGICVCFGNVQDPDLLESAKAALREMGAKWSDKVQIDTTHFVCTTPASVGGAARAANNLSSQPGVEYQKALQASIPIVQPQWVLACHQQRKMMPIAPYYLGETPPPAQFSRSSAALSPSSTPTNAQGGGSSRSGVPPSTSPPHGGSTTPTPEIKVTHDGDESPTSPATPGGSRERDGKPARRRQGTMQKDFKFPPNPATSRVSSSSDVGPNDPSLDSVAHATMDSHQGETSTPPAGVEKEPPVPPHSDGVETNGAANGVKSSSKPEPLNLEQNTKSEASGKGGTSSPADDDPGPVEIPPPTPMAKDNASLSGADSSFGDEDVGETVEVDLT